MKTLEGLIVGVSSSTEKPKKTKVCTRVHRVHTVVVLYKESDFFFLNQNKVVMYDM